MTKIIVFTDLHMLPEGGRIIGLDPFERLAKGIAHVNRHHADADCVVFTGDLAHRGDTASYQRLQALLGQLTLPYHLLIGNHDHREHFTQVFTQQARDAHGFIQSAVSLGATRLLFLDTLYAPPYEFPKSYSGYLCEQRLHWLDDQLAQAKAQSQGVLIFMHHPPHATGFAGMDAIALANGDAFYQRIHQAGNVRHICAGHVHRTISGQHRGISFSVFKSPCHQQPMVFSADDTSLSVDEPAAYGLLFVTPDSVLVHTEDYEISGVNQTLQGDASVHGH